MSGKAINNNHQGTILGLQDQPVFKLDVRPPATSALRPRKRFLAHGRRPWQGHGTALLAMLLLAAPAAWADGWNAGTGNWFTDANWLDGSAPTSTDDATIDNGGTAQVQAPGAVAQDVFVGLTDGKSGFLEITGGGTLSNDLGRIGSGAGSIGAATVDGAGSTWTNSADLSVSDSGTGTLAITNGGTVNLNGGAGTLTLASNVGSTGTLNIEGAAAGILNTATVNGGSGTATLNFNHTDADYFFTNNGTAGGAAVSITGSTAVNHLGTGTTTLTGANTYTGGTTVRNGVLTVDGGSISHAAVDAIIGEQAGDNGALNITNGGTLTNSSGRIGLNPGSTGAVTVDGAGSALINTGFDFNIGREGHGTLTITNGAAVTNATFAGVGRIGNGTGVVTVDGAGSTWTIGGNVDMGGLGSGTLTLSNGGTVIVGGGLSLANFGGSSGTLNIGAGGAPGFVDGALVFGSLGTATLNFNHTDAGHFFTSDGTAGATAAAIDGSVTVNHLGSGTTILTGANNYTGATTINAGTLAVNGSIANSAITVNAGGTLGGTGTTGAVNVADGGTLAPGTSAGTLATGALSLANSALLAFELATPNIAGSGINDLVAVDGDLVLDGVLNVTDLGGLGAGTYTLFTYTGALSDNGLTLGNLPAGFIAEIDASVGGVITLAVAVAAPGLAITPGTVDFGLQAVDTVSAATSATLQNTGSADVSVISVSAPGTPFAAAGGTCGAAPFAIAPGAACTLDFTFSPTVTGAFNTTVEITSDAPSSPDSLTLLGTGGAGGEPALAVPMLNRWSLLFLAGVLGLIGWLRLRRYPY